MVEKRSALGTDDSDSACDVHSVTSAALHCCRVLNTVSQLFYDDQLIPMISRLGIRLSSKATSLHQLLVTLIKTLLEHVASIADDISPGDMVSQVRALDVNTHALYDSGDKEARVSLQWAKKQMFLVNNYYALLTYLSDRRNEERELLNQAKSDVRLKQAVSGWDVLLAEVDRK